MTSRVEPELDALDSLIGQEILHQPFSLSESIRTLVDINVDDLDQLYAHAYHLYETADFEGAKRIFFLLASLEHRNFDYWLALGLSYQRLSQHEEAIFCFSRSGVTRLDDPRSSYYAGVSYQLLGNILFARKAFNASLNWCGQQAAYEMLRSHLLDTLDSCQEVA